MNTGHSCSAFLSTGYPLVPNRCQQQHQQQPRARWCCRAAYEDGVPSTSGRPDMRGLPNSTTQALDTQSILNSSNPRVQTPGTLIPSAPRSYRVPLFEALRFSGPAPEIINGRLAMLGFVCSAVQEAQTGLTVTEQAQRLSVPMFLLLGSVAYASLVPIMKGAKTEAFGWFTPRAEVTNSRAAMLGERVRGASGQVT